MEIINIYGDNRLAKHKKIYEGCRGIVSDKGRILLVYEQKTDQWIIPGGRLKKQESIEECCARELAEETGCLVNPMYHFLTINEYYREWLFVSCYFICEIIEEGPCLLTEEEEEAGLKAEWISPEEAIAIFSRYQEYTDDEMKRGMYFREYRALSAYLNTAFGRL